VQWVGRSRRGGRFGTTTARTTEAGLEAQLITDAGHTEFYGVATHTCVGIGPDLATGSTS
jgi:hypothetical protein